MVVSLESTTFVYCMVVVVVASYCRYCERYTIFAGTEVRLASLKHHRNTTETLQNTSRRQIASAGAYA